METYAFCLTFKLLGILVSLECVFFFPFNTIEIIHKNSVNVVSNVSKINKVLSSWN